MKYKTIHFQTIDSTNSYLKENYKQLEDFTFVSTDYQSKGKGRNDRVWSANENENLLFSLLIKDKEVIKEPSFLSLVAAVNVSEIIAKYARNKLEIKWPNDIYINGKKVAGILLEGRLPEYVVIGIGINVNQKEFAGEYRKEPTSLFLDGGAEVDINELKASIYQKLYDNLHSHASKDKFLKYFEEHDYLINKTVNFTHNNDKQSGVVLGVDENFNIIIKNEEGEHHISSGEIELLK